MKSILGYITLLVVICLFILLLAKIQVWTMPNEVSRKMIGVVIQYEPHDSIFADTERTMIKTTKGQFYVSGIRSGPMGENVSLIEFSDGSRWIEIAGSNLRSKVYGY